MLWLDDSAPVKSSHKGLKITGVVVAVIVILGVIGAIAGGGSKSNPASSPAATTTAAAPAPTSAAVATTTAPAAKTTTAAPKKTSPAVLGANDAAKKDVTITSCAKDDAGFMDAKVLITNHSSKPSNYIVTVVFESPDHSTQLGSGFTAADDVQPGQKSPQEANALKEASGKFVCRVSSVTRYAS